MIKRLKCIFGFHELEIIETFSEGDFWEDKTPAFLKCKVCGKCFYQDMIKCMRG